MTSRQAYKIIGAKMTEQLIEVETKYQVLLRSFQRRLLPGNHLTVRQHAQQQIMQLENAICCIRESAKKPKRNSKSTSQTPQPTAASEASQSYQIPQRNPIPPVPPRPQTPPVSQEPFGVPSNWLDDLLLLFARNGRAAGIGLVIVLIIMGFLALACIKGCSLQESTLGNIQMPAIDRHPSKESTLKCCFMNHYFILKGYEHGTDTIVF